VTLFKIPDPANQEKLANIYKEMPTKAKKVFHAHIAVYLLNAVGFCMHNEWLLRCYQDGKPYIVSVKAGPTIEDQRNQGYTLAAVSTFASLEDMKYYDTGCEAHDALKVEARQMHQGILVVFYESSA
jgi:hypothetical protein